MKAKKVPQKKVVKKSFDSLSASRAVIGLLIVLLGSSVLLLFMTYQNNIMQNNMFYPFMILTFVGMGLLVALLFLINPVKKKK